MYQCHQCHTQLQHNIYTTEIHEIHELCQNQMYYNHTQSKQTQTTPTLNAIIKKMH